eukprot:XP_016660861.1 PREDICTED: uncharacterized protein LOC107884032 [Acyrthosiphon pisum]
MASVRRTGYIPVVSRPQDHLQSSINITSSTRTHQYLSTKNEDRKTTEVNDVNCNQQWEATSPETPNEPTPSVRSETAAKQLPEGATTEATNTRSPTAASTRDRTRTGVAIHSPDQGDERAGDRTRSTSPISLGRF